jgi:uncharacterized caspase-like protein
VYYTKQLFSQANPEDVVFFYFAGHGGQDIFYVHDEYLYFTTLQRILKETKANRKIIFSDACFAGSMRQTGTEDNSNTFNKNLGKNVLLFLASRSNQYSWQYYDVESGVFTHFLLEGLKGGADANNDGYITAKELFVYVYPKVKEKTNGIQIPVMWGKFDKNMVILKKKKK